MWITRSSRVILARLELVRATDLNESGHTGGAASVLPHTTLLLNSLVTQEVTLAGCTAQDFACAGHLELLGNGFSCFNHGTNEQANALGPACKANSLKLVRKKRPAEWQDASLKVNSVKIMDSG
jgi:hypothetical protein